MSEPYALTSASLASASQVTARLVAEPGFDAREAALVGSQAVPLSGSTGAVEVLREGPGRWAARVQTATGCLLVVAENDDPGWRAEIDGRAVEIERAYGAFVGVRVPAGSHELSVRHRAASPLAHLPGLALAFAAVWILRRRRKPSPQRRPGEPFLRQSGPRG